MLCEMHIQGLGFQMNNKGKKTCEILLNSKETDLRNMLGLSHYSLQLSTTFIMEGCMCHILRAHFRSNDAQPLTVTDLFAQGSRFVEIFRNEHMIPYDHDKPRMYERVNYFIENKGI